ncbi:MAG: PIG-L family deacetylase [Bacteroidota bacterium]
MIKVIPLFLFLLITWNVSIAQNVDKGPRVLVVMAHPDDESTMSVTLYKIVKEQHGHVDIFVITNGEAGYKYATLAENYYTTSLTDEKEGRQKLPRIRKQELINAGHILGVSNYYFADQADAKFTINERQPLDSCWDITAVKGKLKKRLLKQHYDFIFCMLPEPGTHGQHKAAALLTLDVLKDLPLATRPVVLGAVLRNRADPVFKFNQLDHYTETQVITDTASFVVDRTVSFSYHNRMNYKVIANWEIAEHKSQGFTQMTMNDGDLESFWFFKQNSLTGQEKCKSLFNSFKHIPYLAKTY